MNGIEAARKLNDKFYGANIIIVSNYNDDESRKEANKQVEINIFLKTI